MPIEIITIDKLILLWILYHTIIRNSTISKWIPIWVHIDKRAENPACARGGYPTIRQGSKGVYVAVLQDALNFLGYNAGNIDGIFGSNTKNAVMRYQKARGLKEDGIVGCNTWETITQEVAQKRK